MTFVAVDVRIRTFWVYGIIDWILLVFQTLLTRFVQQWHQWLTKSLLLPWPCIERCAPCLKSDDLKSTRRVNQRWATWTWTWTPADNASVVIDEPYANHSDFARSTRLIICSNIILIVQSFMPHSSWTIGLHQEKAKLAIVGRSGTSNGVVHHY